MTRKLPFYYGEEYWNPKLHVKLPMGIFVVQPVGNTSYGKGLHVHVHLTGEEESVRGLLSFGARIERDGTVTWHRQQPSYKVDHERAEEIFLAAKGLAEAWFERDPSHCAHYYCDLAVKERWDNLNEIWREEHLRDYLAKLIEDPNEPRPRHEKDGEGEWIEVPFTEEERVARRALWDRNHQRAVDKIARLHLEHDDRHVQLESIAAQCRAFMKGERAELFPFPALLRASLVSGDAAPGLEP